MPNEFEDVLRCLQFFQAHLDMGKEAAIPALQTQTPTDAHKVLLNWRRHLLGLVDTAEAAFARLPTSVDFAAMRDSVTVAEAEIRVTLGMEFFDG